MEFVDDAQALYHDVWVRGGLKCIQLSAYYEDFYITLAFSARKYRMKMSSLYWITEGDATITAPYVMAKADSTTRLVVVKAMKFTVGQLLYNMQRKPWEICKITTIPLSSPRMRNGSPTYTGESSCIGGNTEEHSLEWTEEELEQLALNP
jgi:hypothetical protein